MPKAHTSECLCKRLLFIYFVFGKVKCVWERTHRRCVLCRKTFFFPLNAYNPLSVNFDFYTMLSHERVFRPALMALGKAPIGEGMLCWEIWPAGKLVRAPQRPPQVLSRNSRGWVHIIEWNRGREDKLQSFIGSGVLKIQNSCLGFITKEVWEGSKHWEGDGKGKNNVEDLKSYKSSTRGFFLEESRTRVVD